MEGVEIWGGEERGEKKENMYIKGTFDREDWKRQQLCLVCGTKRKNTDYPLHSPGILNSHTKEENNASYKNVHIRFPRSSCSSGGGSCQHMQLPPSGGKNNVSGGKRKHLTGVRLHLPLCNHRKFPRCCRESTSHPGGIYESLIWLFFFHSSTVSFTQLVWLALLACCRVFILIINCCNTISAIPNARQSFLKCQYLFFLHQINVRSQYEHSVSA